MSKYAFTTKEPLEPAKCPMCGASAEIVVKDSLYGSQYLVRCSRCLTNLTTWKHSRGAAIRNWNRQVKAKQQEAT